MNRTENRLLEALVVGLAAGAWYLVRGRPTASLRRSATAPTGAASPSPASTTAAAGSEITAPQLASVVTVARRAEVAMPKRTSLPSRLPSRYARATSSDCLERIELSFVPCSNEIFAVLGYVGALITAVYSFRLVFRVLTGEPWASSWRSRASR